ncbi:tetraacyldisaccharide 4'-kinase [Phycisphaerales bacterium AB-hyl4]|uniref:Tetraacyldisaccharide 4'-kinase n=1 Tax=Natronomicrosphaera hydrolytica TaxID=3242702 RepID=A0ABV4U4Q6_9BACT
MDTPRLHAILSGRDRSVAGRLARPGLTAAAAGYGAAVQLRNVAFNRGLKRVTPLGRPTVSVGNITAGGTGKTPMVIEFVRRLLASGHRPAVLMRGYGDDETMELQDTLGAIATANGDNKPTTLVIADPDRVRGAKSAIVRDPAVDCFVLDDGFQHRRAGRDRDVVLVDATNPFGYGYLLPRGLLREPVQNLRRADGVIVTRADQVDDGERAVLDERIRRLTGKPAVAHAAHRWTSLRDADDVPWPVERLQSLKVLGVCGIGNPASFAGRLAEHASSLATSATSREAYPGVMALGDHHAYRHDELTDMLREAELRGAEAVVTTEKDWVKWRSLVAGHGLPMPVLRPVLAMQFLDGDAAVDTLLTEMFEPQAVSHRG